MSLNSKRYVFLFTRLESKKWWEKYIKGFNHVALVDITDDCWVAVEPNFYRCGLACTKDFVNPDNFEDYSGLEVTIVSTNEYRLLRPVFMTCVTVVQYIAGISLGCILAQTLYDKLTCNRIDWLASKGIIGVKKWGSIQ